jgi:5-methylcytosine-specific restriction endonuclease McrA
MKRCSICEKTLPADSFYSKKNSRDGLHPWCKPCARAKSNARHHARRDEILPKMRDYYAKNADKWDDYGNGLPYQRRKAQARLRAKNRIMPWNDPSAEDFVFYAASVVEGVYGGKVHVDHVIPLNGKRVSGLHVHSNLQLLNQSANLRKASKWPT